MICIIKLLLIHPLPQVHVFIFPSESRKTGMCTFLLHEIQPHSLNLSHGDFVKAARR